MYEHYKLPLISLSAFAIRVLKCLIFGSLIIVVIICIGMIGFHILESIPWIDSFLEASMFFGGMGSSFVIETWKGKFFAAIYAITCPFALVASITILLLPFLHRFLHKLNIEKGK